MGFLADGRRLAANDFSSKYLNSSVFNRSHEHSSEANGTRSSSRRVCHGRANRFDNCYARTRTREREHEGELVQGNRTFALIDSIEFDTEL